MTALITGASSGIGYELAKVFAKNKVDLVITARNEKKLQEIASELNKNYGVKVQIIANDLSELSSCDQIFEFTQKEKIHIDYLVNNAGFGDFGFYHESDWAKNLQMINLNIVSLAYLTRLYLPAMVAKKSGKILNVASTAAFQPGPTMSVYYATKAFVLHFSEAIANELSDKGITVTALCPGATESGFQQAAQMEESKLVKGKKLPTSKEVAEYGYKAMMNGETVAIHGFMNFLMAQSNRITPRSVVTKVVRMMQNKAN